MHMIIFCCRKTKKWETHRNQCACLLWAVWRVDHSYVYCRLWLNYMQSQDAHVLRYQEQVHVVFVWLYPYNNLMAKLKYDTGGSCWTMIKVVYIQQSKYWVSYCCGWYRKSEYEHWLTKYYCNNFVCKNFHMDLDDQLLQYLTWINLYKSSLRLADVTWVMRTIWRWIWAHGKQEKQQDLSIRSSLGLLSGWLFCWKQAVLREREFKVTLHSQNVMNKWFRKREENKSFHKENIFHIKFKSLSSTLSSVLSGSTEK